MEKNTAEELIKLILETDPIFAKVSEVTRQIEDSDEQSLIRQGVGDVIGRLYTEVMMPILKQYPELDPDLEKKE